MPLLQEYETLVKTGRITDDAGQRAVITHLRNLQRQLHEYIPWSQRRGWRCWRFRLLTPGKPRDETSPPRGVYIWGGVGRGKSMLMDMFFRHLPLKHKLRLHFHAFMTDVHSQIHQWRQLHGGNSHNGSNSDSGTNDPIPPLARKIAAEAYVLCLDEFQVTDVADAIILSRLFGELIRLGTVVVTTSNLPPHDLYTDGLQREYFMKFVRLAQSRWDILELAGKLDYRLQHLKKMQRVYFTPLGKDADSFMENAYLSLTCQADKKKIKLVVGGRIIALSGCGDVAWSSFHELCEQPLGAADYLEIAREFHTLLLSDIPVMQAEMRNQAARFVKLIDALYDHRVKLICSAAAAPDELYTKGDTAFEFQRTASRLMEMQSEQYFSASHIA